MSVLHQKHKRILAWDVNHGASHRRIPPVDRIFNQRTDAGHRFLTEYVERPDREVFSCGFQPLRPFLIPAHAEAKARKPSIGCGTRPAPSWRNSTTSYSPLCSSEHAARSYGWRSQRSRLSNADFDGVRREVQAPHVGMADSGSGLAPHQAVRCALHSSSVRST